MKPIQAFENFELRKKLTVKKLTEAIEEDIQNLIPEAITSMEFMTKQIDFDSN